jgi:prolyl-tRNA editing enzyme YbaK/EbsC (Cys-tRNA(Pro) deacylase)
MTRAFFCEDSMSRTETVSAKVTTTTEEVAQHIAASRGVSLSDLINTLLVEEIERERVRYLKLSRAFSVNQDKPAE